MFHALVDPDGCGAALRKSVFSGTAFTAKAKAKAKAKARAKAKAKARAKAKAKAKANMAFDN